MCRVLPGVPGSLVGDVDHDAPTTERPTMTSPTPRSAGRGTAVVAVIVLTFLAVVVGGIVRQVVVDVLAPAYQAEVVKVSSSGGRTGYQVRFQLADGTECVSTYVGGSDDPRVGDTVYIQYTDDREPCATVRPYGSQLLFPLGLIFPLLLIAAYVYAAWRHPQVLPLLRAHSSRTFRRRHRELWSSVFRDALGHGEHPDAKPSKTPEEQA
jgi:hypothetical protein